MQFRYLGKYFKLYFFNSEILTIENKKLIGSSLFFLFIIISAVNTLYIYKKIDLVVENKRHLLQKTLDETREYTEEIDLSFTSELLSSQRLIVLFKNGKEQCLVKDDGVFIRKNFEPDMSLKIKENKDGWFINPSLGLVMIYKPSINNSQYQTIFYSLDVPDFVLNDLVFNVVITVIFFICTTLIVVFITSKVRLSDLIAKAGNEAMLATKNSQKFTEAMHHEVKTPLANLNSGYDQLETILEDLWANIDDYEYIRERLLEKKDFLRALSKRISLNFELIYNVLEKQKSVRAIKYSNGNYNLYELIEHSFQSLRYEYKTKYTYSIDDRLKRFSNKTRGLKNADFTNIITNHIRNSLEANANHLKLVLSEYDVRRSMISLLIADNGNGIPDDVQGMIYLPNFSTKQLLKDSDNQGVGMYLCQTLLNDAGGYEEIRQSGAKGTVFDIHLPIAKHNLNDRVWS